MHLTELTLFMSCPIIINCLADSSCPEGDHSDGFFGTEPDGLKTSVSQMFDPGCSVALRNGSVRACTPPLAPFEFLNLFIGEMLRKGSKP